MYNKELAKENKVKTIAKIALAMVCVSLIGGYVYYINSPAELQLRNEQMFNNNNNDNEIINDNNNVENIDKIELTDWEKESIAKAMLEREEIEQKKIELAEAEPNVIQKSIAGINGIINNTKEEKIQVWDNVTNNISQLKKSNNEERTTIQKEGYDQMGHPYLKEGQSYTFSDGGMGAPNEAPISGRAQVINPNTGEEWSYLYNGHWNNADVKKMQAEIDKMQNREVGKMGSFTDEEVKQFMENMTINMGSMK